MYHNDVKSIEELIKEIEKEGKALKNEQHQISDKEIKSIKTGR